MELPTVSSLEFEQLKSSIKTFIKTKTDFQDYDFEGSNLSMLVDILAYNTLYTSYNVSMSANELNLDTAVLRDNVVSIAKRLGYNPSSYTSSRVSLNITVNNTENYDSISLLPGPILSANSGGKNYTFILRDRLEVDVRGKTLVLFPEIELVEGTDFSITYTVDSSNEHQRFFIPNSFVDVETIRAFVIMDSSTNIEEEYDKKTTIIDVTAESKIFFVEEVQDQKYEIIFGDDVFGRKLRNGEIIRIQYVVSSGPEANNIRSFNFIGSIVGKLENLDNLISLSNIEYDLISEFSDGGSEFEDIKSIKYAAPRYYSSQERAVTTSDYESIIRQIYPNADLVSVIGGEFLSPPKFGEIFITIKPTTGEKVSFNEKNRIIENLKKYQVGSVTTTILDPSVININLKIYIVYDKTKTRKTVSDLISGANESVLDYIKTDEFNSFGGRYSNSILNSSLKNVDKSIQFVSLPFYLSIPTEILGTNIDTEYTIDFHTKFKTCVSSTFYIMSDPFSHTNYASPVFLGVLSNSTDVNMYTTSGVFLKTVGSVDILTGKITFIINPVKTTVINIFAIPDINEIVFGPNNIINLVVNLINVDDKNFEEYLNPDINVLPEDEILKKPAGGDPNALVQGNQIDSESIIALDPETRIFIDDQIVSITEEDSLIVEDPDGNRYRVRRPIPEIGGSSPIILPTKPPKRTPIFDPSDPTGGTDPNNIATIDNFTPELDPTICS